MGIQKETCLSLSPDAIIAEQATCSVQCDLMNNAAIQTVSEPLDSQFKSGGCDHITLSTDLTFEPNSSITAINIPTCEDSLSTEDLDSQTVVQSCPW